MITITIKVKEDDKGQVLVECDNTEVAATNRERLVAHAISRAARDEFEEILASESGGVVKVEERKVPMRGIKPEGM